MKHPGTGALDLLVVGLALMFGSNGWVGLGGHGTRLAALVAGLACVALAFLVLAIARIRMAVLFAVVAGAGFVLFQLIMGLNSQILGERTMFFELIAVVLFMAGGLTAANPQPGFLVAWSHKLVVPVLIIISSMCWQRFLSEFGAEKEGRNFDDETLSPIGVAYGFGCCCVVSMVFFLHSTRIWTALLHAGAMAAAAVCLLSTASRGPMIWLAVTGMLIFATSIMTEGSSLQFFRPRYKLLLPVAGVAAGIFALESMFHASRLDYFLERLQGLEDISSDETSGGRFAIMDSYFRYPGRFWLCGWERYDVANYPHNMFAEMFVRFGLAGLALALLVIVSALYGACRAREILRQSVASSLLLALFAYGFLVGQSSLALEMNRALWLGLGFLAGHYLGGAKEKRRP